MKKLSVFLMALSSGLYPCVAYASSDDEIKAIVKPCVDKIVSSVAGSGEGFSDDDLIKCASDLTRVNNKISISKAIAIVGFYAGEAYKPNNDPSDKSAETYSNNTTASNNTTNPRTQAPERVDITTASTDDHVMSEKDDPKTAVVIDTVNEAEKAPPAKAVLVTANRIMTDYELNEEKADDVYKDRRLCIKGKISKISVLGDDPFVEMSADSYGLRNVKFTLDKSRVEVLDNLQVGDIKVIEGTVVGYTLFKVSVTDPVLY